MRILVTGSEGYIGAVMVPLLQSAGHEVVGLDTGFYPGTLGPYEPTHRIVTADVRDVDVSVMTGFDAVVHLAALSNDPLGDLGEGLTDEINHRASVRLAGLARDAGVERFVFASSCSLYGAGGDDLVDEDGEMHPVTAYGHSKIDAERSLSELASDDFSPTYMRNATAYGFSPRLRIDIVVNNLVAHAIANGRVHMTSDGTPWRPLVHIGDISAATMALLEAPREVVHDRPFNIGAPGENYRIRDVAALVAEAVPGAEVTMSDRASPDIRDYQVDFGRLAHEVPGFRPSWSVRSGAEELAEAYRRNGFGVEQLEGPWFARIRRIQELLGADQLDGDLRWRQPVAASA